MPMPVVVGKRDLEARDLQPDVRTASPMQAMGSVFEPSGEEVLGKRKEGTFVESTDDVDEKRRIETPRKHGKKKAHRNSGGDDLMPFRKVHRRRGAIVGGDCDGAVHKIRADHEAHAVVGNPVVGESETPTAPLLQKRRSMIIAEDFLSSLALAEAGDSTAVSTGNPPELQQVVSRGPDWVWGEEDGGHGKVGTVWSISEDVGTVTVFWHETQHIGDHYQYMTRSDLASCEHLASSASLSTTPVSGSIAGSQRHSVLERAMTGVRSALRSPSRKGRHDASQSDTPVVRADAVATTPCRMQRRCSQVSFASRSQAIIIFDWDDTLFPTTYVRDDLALPWNKTLEEQHFSGKAECARLLKDCSATTEKVLRQAHTLGKVVLVTLAKRPWVDESCKNFYPRVGKLIEELSLPIVYAQEDSEHDIEYDKKAMMSSEEVELYYAGMKGKAIAKEIASFYSRYEGQSWKNITSVGDADFERYGTFGAVEAYMKERGLMEHGTQKDALLKAGGHMEETLDAEGHVFRIRTKVFKMMDQPTAEELQVELRLLHRWLPHLVLLDDGCDLGLDDLDDSSQVRAIEAKLGIHSRPRPASPGSKRSASKESAGTRGRSLSARRPSGSSASSFGSGGAAPDSAGSSPKGKSLVASVASWATGRRRATK